MAVLPWVNSRTQTDGHADKSKTPSLDWFSRATAEPSRQAINQLMKQHSRGTSGGAVSVRVKSRATTPTSQMSQTSQHRSAPSRDSRPEQGTRVSSERSYQSQSRPGTPSARPRTPPRSGTPVLERSDSSSKSLFQKGSLLRRKGSKIGINFNASPTNNVVSPSRPSSSRAGFRVREHTSSPIKDDSRRPSISMPFDFAHVMHGDITAFTGLGRIDESDLASQFDAIQARYRLTNDLGEPYPEIPEMVTPTVLPAPSCDEEPTALPQISSFVAPRTPRPTPPPKDRTVVDLTVGADIHMSRSSENFSRPNPRSPVRPSSCHLNQLTASPSVIDPAVSSGVKPLPQVPTIIHAVSTIDDTARPLISAPLPTPPIGSHRRQSSSKTSLRHMSTFPSSRNPHSVGPASEGQLLNIREEEGMIRPHSDYEASKIVNRKHSSEIHQVSVEDWEDAIDSAWDLEDEEDMEPQSVPVRSHACESFLTIEQPEQDHGSLPSTPLMTMAPSRRPHLATVHDQQDCQPSLVGLGLGVENNNEASTHVSRPPALEIVTSNHTNGSPRMARSAYSVISHSSSQESIILSIASSIMSTQRSSVSSVSVSDYPYTAKSDRSSIANSANSPLLTVTSQKTARPDSSCLPSSLLKVTPESQKTARPDSTCLPSIPLSQRNSVVARSARPESIGLTREMLGTFPVPEVKSRRAVNPSRKSRGSIVEYPDEEVQVLPAGAQKRASQVTHSHRVSSAPKVEVVPSSRRRSSAQLPKSRPSRVSYSLFPAAGSSAAVSSNQDPDVVAS